MGIANIICFYIFYWDTEPVWLYDIKSNLRKNGLRVLPNTDCIRLLLSITNYVYEDMFNIMGKLWEN